ncbi:unnamed protein product [Rhizophagus irregularis]|nr:unnamed protein product [Rhizophagus irregularis]CAB5304046.1 unnamed protein product [Rhizophagus irregularis]
MEQFGSYNVPFGFRASERRMPIKTEQTRFSLGASERMALIERNNTVDEPYLHNKGRQTLENEMNPDLDND